MSSRPHLPFERLEVRRMPGIDPGFTIDGLCPGINVICGPNASGKTSLTRAVSTLLWPRSSASRAVLSGTFSLDGGSWRVGFDSGSLLCQCDGQDADFPAFDTAEESDRYLLALHDLLRADNRGFAEAILRESTGGYDVGQAMSALGFVAKPSTQAGLKNRLDQATELERKARQTQEALRQEERRREELLIELELARNAGFRVSELERALDLQCAAIERDDAARVLATFPAILEALSGNELDELQHLRERQRATSYAVEQEQLAIIRARERRDSTGLSSGLQPAFVATLRTRCAELQDAASDLRAATERVVASEAVVEAARRAIGPDADDQRLAALNAVQFNALAELLGRSRDAHAVLAGLTAIASWIPPSAALDPEQTDESATLRMGVRILNRWLRAGHPEPATVVAPIQRQSRLIVVAACLAIAEALLLGVLAHPAFLVLLPLGVVLLGIGFRRRTPVALESVPVTDRSALLRREYDGLGLPAPVRWEPDAVETLVEALSQRVRDGDLENAKRQRWQYVHDQRPAALRQAIAIDALVAGFCQQFGIPSVSDVAALHTLANAISIWQTERGRADASCAVLAMTQARVDSTLRSINADLQPFGYANATSYADASGAIDALAKRAQGLSDALSEEQRANQRIAEQLQPQLDRCLDELQTFFDRFQLAGDDEHGLRLLLDRLPEYRVATRAVDLAALEFDRAQAALGDAAPLARRSQLDLNTELDETRHLTQRLDAIRGDIATIDARIEQARHGHDLEAALANQQTIGDALRDARDAGEALAAGWTLGEYVRRQTRDVDRPRVFHRARELFVRITQGRYELDVDGSDPPRFRARDTVSGTGHALDELSSGTRLQLLLAVRVAFVEHQERGPKLPLIFDETLGNSDEHRARAIIDATVQIAREGRQVLYLTAQHDEVYKWQAIMAEQTDVPFALVDLAHVRGLSEWERLPPAAPQPWPLPVVPAPNGHDREAYGALLRVPGVDLSAPDAGSLHLWHVIDEPLVLYRLLSMQIETWGQLRTIVEHGGNSLFDETPGVLERCFARARVIATIAESWRVGRGRPIDRAVLLDSEAVSDVFLDRAVDLAASLEGDAGALIEAIEQGRLPRFYASYRGRLQAYFEEHGFIDPTPAPSFDDVRARVLVGASADLASDLLTVEWVNSTLATLWGVRDRAEAPTPPG